MDSLIGKKLDGRYLVESLVGRGGMANVYRGQDTRSGNPIAIKVLKEEFLDNDELVRRFKNESKAISILDHPNIVRVYDVSVTDRLQYIVMEYIDGITLKEYLRQRGGVLSWKEVVYFATQVLSALQHAHSKGIVHRDVKPQNIMLLADGSIKMMDFGIARFSRAQSQTVSDKAIGSVHYISPEQAKGDRTDARTDIYSVGVMMYEMLSGSLPFDGNGAVSIAIKQISDKARPLAEVAPSVPEGLCQITEKAMEKDPDARFQSAGEMLNALEAFKRNPSILFEYEYNTQSDPGKTINKVVNANKPYPASQDAVPHAKSNVRTDEARRAGTNNANKKKKKKKRQKKYHFSLFPIFFGLAVAFVIGALILVYLIFSHSSSALFSNREDVQLINFVGMTRDEFLASDYNARLTPVWVYEYNDTQEEGVIYQQTPRSGRTVKEGQKVTLKVSMGTQWVTVPETRNYSRDEALRLLSDAGLVPITTPVDDTSVAAGTVVYTEPGENESVAAGTTINVYVSREQLDVKRVVPSVVGLTLSEARSTLVAAKLGTRTIDVNSEEPEGTVIGQTPEGGSEARVLDLITLKVSTGIPQEVVDLQDLLNSANQWQEWVDPPGEFHRMEEHEDGSVWDLETGEQVR